MIKSNFYTLVLIGPIICHNGNNKKRLKSLHLNLAQNFEFINLYIFIDQNDCFPQYKQLDNCSLVIFKSEVSNSLYSFTDFFSTQK